MWPISPAGLALVAAVVVAACEALPRDSRIAAGHAAPEYSASTLDGQFVAMDELLGEVVLLNVWATWCIPCREEMPALQALHERFSARGLRVVAVSIDHARAGAEIREFLDRHGIQFTVLHDPDGRINHAYRTVGVPESFLIDRDGSIAARWRGPFDPFAEDAMVRIERALKAAPRSGA